MWSGLRRYSGHEVRHFRLILALSASVLQLTAMCQGPATRKPLTGGVQFEVVSIRPSRAGSAEGMSYSYLPDGYRARGQSLWSTILFAYYPSGMKYWRLAGMKGAPGWVGDQLYDIDAKVADNDQAAWQAQGTANVLLKAALQEALSERCHLVLHESLTEAKVMKLVAVGKSQGALIVSLPGEKAPDNVVKIPGLGQFVPSSGDIHFYQSSMKELAAYLTNPSIGPILDGTGLQGRYDFVLERVSRNDGESEPGLQGYVPFQLTTLGLGLKGGTASVTTLVIDHVDRPSDN